MRRDVTYPFKPKSTAMLRPGQFWAVPLSNDKFACGRVLQIGTAEIPTKTRAFFGGLHDWVEPSLPTAESIAGTGFLAFGIMHIKAIEYTGRVILGQCSLEEDAIELPTLLSARGGPGTHILNGSEPIREARKDEWGTLPVLGYWGYDFIKEIAETKLVNKSYNKLM